MKKTCMLLCIALAGMHYATAQKPVTAAEYYWDADPGEGHGHSISIGTTADSVKFKATIPVAGLSTGFHTLYARTYGDSLKWSLTEQANVFIYQIFSPSAPLINAAEYFWDADPGEGKGIAITVSTPADSARLTTAMPTKGMPQGFHALYVRTKNASGNWALAEQREVYIYQNVAPTAPNIVAAEYFWDTDPGEGSGKSINVATVLDSVHLTALMPTAGLSVGFHALYVRTKDATGRWALVEQRETYVYKNITTTPPNIVAAEYFWDVDPGENQGRSITVSAPSDSVHLVPTVAANIPQGFHQLYVRAKDANSHWSLVDQRTLYLTNYVARIDSIINAAEYFIDTDPGEGKATPITVSLLGDTIKQNFTINIPKTIDTGYHLVYVRTRTSHGLWGVTESAQIHVGSGSLPITLLYFRAALQKNNVTIDWETTTEINSSVFEVQRMANSGDFITINSQPGAGNSVVPRYYQAVDNNPPYGPLFYRLKEVDKDGRVTFSMIVKVDNNTVSAVKLYPNPAKFTIHIDLPLLTYNKTIIIYNALGQPVMQESLAEGAAGSDVDVSRLAAGEYYVVLTAKDGSRSTINFTRQ